MALPKRGIDISEFNGSVDIAALQGGAGLLLREKRIYIVRYFLYDHGAGLPTNFVLRTIISHFAIFALQKAEKFGRTFDIIMTK